MPVVEFGGEAELALLVHLMSAGRLQVFDKRASLKDRALAGPGPARRRPRAAAARVRHQAARLGEAARRPARSPTTRWSRRSAPRPGRRPPLERARRGCSTSRATCTRCCATSATIAGIGRSWVDEILWEARLSPFKKGSELDDERGRAPARRRSHVLGDAIDHYEEVVGETVPDKMPMPLQVHRREGEPCPRCGDDDRGRLLRRAPDQLLPGRADRRPGAQGPPALAAAQVGQPVSLRAPPSPTAPGHDASSRHAVGRQPSALACNP